MLAIYNYQRYKSNMKVQKGLDFVRAILGNGRFSFTLKEAAEATGLGGQALNMMLQRLKRDGWVLPFSKGFYLALDVQHQASGMLDPVWFIDDWAKFLGVEYYVCGLSAAAMHGAAHQRPAVFQVMMNRSVRSVKCGSVKVQVCTKKEIAGDLIEQRKSSAGYYWISSPEMTAYDVMAYERCCASIDLAATVFAELGETIGPDSLASLPKYGCNIAVLQRVGWLLDRCGWKDKTDQLHAALRSHRRVWRLLDSRLPSDGLKSDRWKIIENTYVYPDTES